MVDLDRTLFDTDRFVDWVWQVIAKEYKIDTEYERQRAELFYSYYEDWYDYQFFDHIASISTIDSSQDEFERRVRSHQRDNFLFTDALETLSLYDEIITFGNQPYQRFKLSMCPELHAIPATIITEMKANYIKHHYRAPVVLIDDKNLSDELPDWARFFLVDRTQQQAMIQHSADFTSMSSLRELIRLL